jgi:hypothetical protein
MEIKGFTQKKCRICWRIRPRYGHVTSLQFVFVPSKIVVSGDAAADAKNILKHEALFLAGMVGHLYSAIVFHLVGIGALQVI